MLVKLTHSQNGPDANDPAEQAQIATQRGAAHPGGGIGGVGGEGLGGAVTDAATLAALNNPTETARRRT